MTEFCNKQDKNKIKMFNEMCNLLDQCHWSDELVEMVEKSCGLDVNYHKIIFPRGKKQIVPEFESWIDSEMLKILHGKNKPVKIREQIYLALETRIINTVSKNVILNNSSFFAVPTNILIGKKSVYKTCDIIWRYAGDKSTDHNYYTKRGLLFIVYMSAKTFYIADNSKNHEETKKFIKNALDNIINIASFKKRINVPRFVDIPILRLFS